MGVWRHLRRLAAIIPDCAARTSGGRAGTRTATGADRGWTRRPAATSDEHFYALDANGILYAFRIADGAEPWHRQLLSGSSSDTAGTSLAVAAGSLYLGSTSGTVYAVGAATGRQRWTYHPGSGLYADLALSAGVVYLKDNNGTIHAVSAVTGKALWTRAATETGFHGLTAAGGQVYYTTALALQALDAKNGSPTWAFSPSGNAELLSIPAVASGLVLIGSHDDSLYAIKA